MSAPISVTNGWIIVVLDLDRNFSVFSSVHFNMEETLFVTNSVLSMSRQILGPRGMLEIMGSFLTLKEVREDFLKCRAPSLAKTKFAIASYLQEKNLQMCFHANSNSQHSALLVCARVTERFLKQNPKSPFAPLFQKMQAARRERYEKIRLNPLKSTDCMMYESINFHKKAELEKKMREYIDLKELKKVLGIIREKRKDPPIHEAGSREEEEKFVDSLFNGT